MDTQNPVTKNDDHIEMEVEDLISDPEIIIIRWALENANGDLNIIRRVNCLDALVDLKSDNPDLICIIDALHQLRNSNLSDSESICLCSKWPLLLNAIGIYLL